MAGVASESGHDTAVAFGFDRLTETIQTQNPDGSAGTPATFSFDLVKSGGGINPVDHDELAAFAHAHPTHHDFFMI